MLMPVLQLISSVLMHQNNNYSDGSLADNSNSNHARQLRVANPSEEA